MKKPDQQPVEVPEIPQELLDRNGASTRRKMECIQELRDSLGEDEEERQPDAPSD